MTEASEKVSVFRSLKSLQQSEYFEEDFKEKKVNITSPINEEIKVEQPIEQQQTTPLFQFDFTQQTTQSNEQTQPAKKQQITAITNDFFDQQEVEIVNNVTSSGGIRLKPNESELKDFSNKIITMDMNKICKALIKVINEGQGKQRTVCYITIISYA